MSILIEGMEMPKNCANCPLSRSGCSAVLKRANTLEPMVWIPRNYRHDDCPLVEVPKHGRLIDADLFSKVLKGRAAEEWNQHISPLSWSYAYECLIDTVGLTPTVIPADKDGET